MWNSDLKSMDPSQYVFSHSAIDPSILSNHSRVIDPSQLAIEEVFFSKASGIA